MTIAAQEAEFADTLKEIQVAHQRAYHHLLGELENLKQLVNVLHPGEDGGEMLQLLETFAEDRSKQAAMRQFARQWTYAEESKTIDLAEGHLLKERIAAFWPLWAITGGNGQPCAQTWRIDLTSD